MVVVVESSGGAAGERLPLASSRLVGREREFADLTEALATPPALVLIEGEAGVGKSRLLRELLADTAVRTTALVATCPPFREPLTLGTIVDAIRRPAAAVTDLGLTGLTDLAGALRPLFPEWSGELPPLPDPAEDATASRHRLFRALAELLAGMGVSLLVVEDVHWADDATLEFLLFLATQPDPVNLVLTYRPEELPVDSLVLRMSSRPARGTGATRIALSPLDVAGSAALVSSMLHGAPLSEEFAEFLYERTSGVPFALEESVRLMYERSDLIRRHDRWERVGLGELQVPTTVRDAILERVERLGREAQAVLRAAAVLAEPSDQETVAATSGLDDGSAAEALAEAVASRLLREDEEGWVAYAHMLACRAVYEATPTLQRRALHLRAATVLETRSPELPARLARHFRETVDASAWHRYGEQAADLALATGDEAAAGELLYDLAVHGDVSAEALLRLVRKVPTGTLFDPGRYDGLVGELRRALDRPGLAVGVAAQLRAQLGQLLAVTEDYEAARAEIELALPGLHHDPAEAARAMTLLGWPVGTALETSAYLSWLDRAAALSPRLGTVDRLTLAVDRVTALLVLGEEAGWAEADRIPAASSSPEERPQVTRGHLNVGDMALRWGRYAPARRHLDRALDLADRHQYQRYRTGVLVTQVRLDWFTGSWRGLAARAADLVGALDMSPLVRHEAALVEALLSATDLGTSDRAAAALEALLDDVRAQGTEQHLMEPAAALARWRLAQGQVEEALAATEEPFAVVTRSGIWIWATELAVAHVETLVAAGLMAEARELVAAYDRWLGGRDAPAPQAAIATCRAVLSQGGGDHPEAATRFARAAAAWEALPRPYDGLLAREQQGRCRLAAGRTDDGVTVLTRTHEDLATLGASADAARVAHLLREHGVQVRRRPAPGGRPSYGDQLSPRESQVLRLLVEGHTNRQIAERLFLSPWTVRHHVDAAKRKLNAGSRAALAAAAVESGAVESGAVESGAVDSGLDDAPR